jgi:hypothetical protein
VRKQSVSGIHRTEGNIIPWDKDIIAIRFRTFLPTCRFDRRWCRGWSDFNTIEAEVRKGREIQSQDNLHIIILLQFYIWSLGTALSDRDTGPAKGGIAPFAIGRLMILNITSTNPIKDNMRKISKS